MSPRMYYGKVPDYRRRLINSVGNWFIIGGACGSAYHFIRGLLGSPSGARLAAGVQGVLRNAPRHAGRMAACSALFCSVETAISLARQRDDPWGSIAAGAATLGLLGMRRGAHAAARSSAAGAAAVGVTLGLGWYVSEYQSRLMSRNNAQMYLDRPRLSKEQIQMYLDMPHAQRLQGLPQAAPSSTSE